MTTDRIALRPWIQRNSLTAWLIAAPPTISQPNALGRLVEMKTTLPVLSRTFYLVYS